MHKSQNYFVVVVLIMLTSIMSHHGIAQELLTDFSVRGDWITPAIGDYWLGPVIADLENDGGPKEFIIADETQLWVFESDGELRENFPVDIPDEDYYYRYSPTVGKVNGIDGLGIVLCGCRRAGSSV